MAVKGLDIFKLSPKKNCKECGSPTCMAFCMKVAQGAVPITKCPYMSEEAVALLSEATAPPMKTIEVGTHKLGGETVMMRHEKTLVNRNLFAATLATDMDDAAIDARIEGIKKVDYERIGEREMVECVFVHDAGDSAKFVELCKKAAAIGDRTVIIDTKDVDTAKAAVEAIKDNKPILNGANKDNFAAMSEIAKAAGLVLGVSGKDLSELHDTVAELEKAGNKNLILDVTAETIKETFANAVLVRRTAIKDGDRTFGYPSIVNLGVLCNHDEHLETALAAMFVVKYGSIIVMDKVGYAEAQPLYGHREFVITDPQKPMKVAPGIYPINGAGPDDPCALTVDFALTYFLVSGELERSKVPVNLLITDASGMSVLTAWAAGKFSSTSVKKFFDEFDLANKINNRTLIIPGKVAVMKGEIQDKLPEWNVVVGTREAVELVKFLRDGEHIITEDTVNLTEDSLINAMVGRTLDNLYPKEFGTKGEVWLEAKGLNEAGVLHDVSFKAHAGQITGFAGLVGAGRTETMRAVFGADKLDSGEIYVKGEKVHIRTPKDAIKRKIAFLTEDRKGQGLVLNLDVRTNLVLANMKGFSNGPFLNKGKIEKSGQDNVESLRIKTPSLDEVVGQLSGGNQQKVVIGKWVNTDADIFIFDEPTRGIDVGAKIEVYRVMNDLVKAGKCVIMVSSELPEILAMSDHVVVMRGGRVMADIDRDTPHFNSEDIMKAAWGGELD